MKPLPCSPDNPPARQPRSVRKRSVTLMKSGLLLAVVWGAGVQAADQPSEPATAAVASSSITPASALTSTKVRRDAPRDYEVMPGDTLWSISAVFLKTPWMWPQLWQGNPQLANPDLIYPGDRLSLSYNQNGEPRLTRQESGVLKLSPGVRMTQYREAVPAIPLKAIEPFIERHQVFSEEAIHSSAYVLGAEDGRIVSGAGDLIYVRRAEPVPNGSRLLVYREQQPYLVKNASGDEQLLGTEMKYIATVQQLSTQGDIAVMRVVQAREEVRQSDLVTVSDQGVTPATFYPSAPSGPLQGTIISVLSGVRYAGKNAVVALNLGADQELKPGHVLSIRQQRPPVKDGRTDEQVELPSEETGKLMVFRTFAQVSYALVMEAEKPISVGDQLVTPAF